MRVYFVFAIFALMSGAVFAGPPAPLPPAEPSLAQDANGHPVAVEEVGALERALEGQIRDVLDGIIKPDQYAVYAEVNIRPDPKVIQDLSCA